MQAEPIPNRALAEAIDASGFRKGWIAEQVGIAPATLSRYLSGEQTPERLIREKLALLLRRRPDEFIGGHGPGVNSTSAASADADGRQAA